MTLVSATRIVRIFNTYGPRMRLKDGRVVPAFVSQALRNEPITVFGDGLQTRDYVYGPDVARANVLAADAAMPAAVEKCEVGAYGRGRCWAWKLCHDPEVAAEPLRFYRPRQEHHDVEDDRGRHQNRE